MWTSSVIDEPRRGRTGDETKERGRPMLGDKSRLTRRAQPLIHARGMRGAAAWKMLVRPFDRLLCPEIGGFERGFFLGGKGGECLAVGDWAFLGTSVRASSFNDVVRCRYLYTL